MLDQHSECLVTAGLLQIWLEVARQHVSHSKVSTSLTQAFRSDDDITNQHVFLTAENDVVYGHSRSALQYKTRPKQEEDITSAPQQLPPAHLYPFNISIWINFKHLHKLMAIKSIFIVITTT
jgi:hypothetical protein